MSASKVPLALLPGLLCTEELWRHQIETLDDLAEPWVADLTLDDNVGDMAERVLEAMPERFALAGLSMGGYVAFEIMRRAPERVSLLALFDTSPAPDSDEQTSRRRGLIELAEKGDFKGVTPRLLPMLIHEDRLDEPEIVDVVTRMAGDVGKEGFLRQQKAIMGRPDSRSLLPAINCPTLVLCGREDALTPIERHQEMAVGIPDAALTVIDDCGHLAPLERPEPVNRAMRGWLKRG